MQKNKNRALEEILEKTRETERYIPKDYFLAVDLHTYANYEAIEAELKGTSRCIKEDRDFYYSRICSALQMILPGKTDEEIEKVAEALAILAKGRDMLDIKLLISVIKAD